MGLHAADLIHEASNAMANGTTLKELKFNVHAHPTLAEVIEVLYHGAELHEKAAPKALAR